MWPSPDSIVWSRCVLLLLAGSYQGVLALTCLLDGASQTVQRTRLTCLHMHHAPLDVHCLVHVNVLLVPPDGQVP